MWHMPESPDARNEHNPDEHNPTSTIVPDADAWVIPLSPEYAPSTPSKLPLLKGTRATAWPHAVAQSVSRRCLARQTAGKIYRQRLMWYMMRHLPEVERRAAAKWHERMKSQHDAQRVKLAKAKQRVKAQRAALLIQKYLRGALVRCAKRVAKEAREAEAEAYTDAAAQGAFEAAEEWWRRAAAFFEEGDDERAAAACERAAAKVGGGDRALHAGLHVRVSSLSAQIEHRRSRREVEEREKRAAKAQADLRRALAARERGDFAAWEAYATAAHLVLASEATSAEVALVAYARARPEMLSQAGRVLKCALAHMPHAALGIPHHAPPKAVRKAYKALAMKLHPDKNDGHPICEAAMKALQDVYDAIKRRASYQAQM